MSSLVLLAEASSALSGFQTLAVGLACILIVLIVEWKDIWNYRRIRLMTLAEVEKLHPRLPPRREMIIVAVLSIAFLLLFSQFVSIVYAAAFTLSSSTTESKERVDLFMGDLDGDGDVDYVAGNTDAANIYKLDLYLNNGAGAFTNSNFGSSTLFSESDAADIDGDGDIDFIVTQDGAIKKYVNNGSATFTSYTVDPSPSPGARALGVFDADNDGDLDIVVASTGTTQSVYLNDGHGNFSAAASTLPSLVRFMAADFNSDGVSDLVFVDSSADPNVYLNSGTGAFVQSFTQATTLLGTIAVGDFDGDGDIDFSAVNTSAQFFIYKNNGQGTSFTAGTVTNINIDSARATAVGDVDNDGDLDVIIGGAEGVIDGARLYVNDGTGVFTENGTATETSDGVRAVAIGDIDGDGDLDYIRGNGDVGGEVNRHYKNDQAATSANTAPTAPSSLTGALQGRTPKNGATFVDDAGVGSNIWGFPERAAESDDSAATTNSMNTNDISHYLKATDFRYVIPTSATIFGIQVDVERKHSGGLTMRDHAIRIVKGGTIGSTDRSSASDWPASDAYASYGGPTDLWGETWTANEINASGFGFALSVKDILGFGGGSVDHMRITVYYSAADVRLRWGSGSDSQTATRLLQYQVRMGTGASANNIVSSKTASPHWVSRVMPNGQSRTHLLKDLPCGKTYYWNVATVDTGFKSAWGSTEQVFILDSSCGISFPLGGGGTAPPTVGGGLPASYFRTNQDLGESPGNGTITVSGFGDLDGDGTKSEREQYAFKGLPFTASGRTAEDLAVRKTLKLDDKGQIAFQLPPSDDRGYWINVDTGSTLLVGYEATGKTSSGGYVLKSGSKVNVNFGFRREGLLAYKPCLAIGAPEKDEASGIDAFVLLQRLEDAFGTKTMRDVEFSGDLVKRRAFFALLERMQCIGLDSDPVSLQKKLRQLGKGREHLSFVDVPLNVRVADSLLAYSLLAAGADVSRATSIGPAADLQSPITRREAIRAVVSLLPISASGSLKTSGTLPTDLDPNDPLVPDFLTLQKLGILPESFLPILGANQGVDVPETAILLARAAFAAGKIHLLPEVATKPKGKPAAPIATFLQELPALKPRTCLEKDKDRAAGITFKDVLPGDPLYFDLRELLTHGSRGGDKKMLWLTAATRRPTEFGIVRGQTKAALMEPVTVLETIRDLLVLACLPPDPKIDVASGKKKSGAEGTLAVKDKISDLPRDASFASRVLYRAQDQIREFNLSLFTYAPHLLRLPPRSPTAGLSVEEATDLLASGLLMIQVRTKAMSPQDGEKTFAALSTAIRRDLLGKDVNWRDAAILKNTPFTRGMLMQFFATVLLNRTTVPVASTPPPIPLGEIWWERIR